MRAELDPVFADLPGATFPAPPGPVARSAPRRRMWRLIPAPLLVLFAVLVAVAVVTRAPWILFAVGDGSCSAEAIAGRGRTAADSRGSRQASPGDGRV